MTKLVGLLLLLALAAYGAAYVIRALRNTTVTTEAVAAEFSLTAAAGGIVIREETTLYGGSATVVPAAPEGKRVPAGGLLATAARSEAGLQRANRLRELEGEIARLSQALEAMGERDAASRDASVSAAARALASAVARHAPEEADGPALALAALLTGGAEDVSQVRLDALLRERDSLMGSVSADAVELTAPAAGVFSPVADGWEHLSFGDLKDLSPARLRAMLEDRREPDPGIYGKLVTDHRWYFAGAMGSREAAFLRPGDTVELSFGRAYGGLVSALVVSVSAEEEGSVAVVFRCDTALGETLGLRKVSAQVVLDRFTGVRIPAAALRTDEETGQTYVFTVTAGVLERKDVEVLYSNGEFVLAARSPAAGALREGNTVVVSGEDLHEGKVL